MFASLKGLWDLIAIFKRLLEWFIAEENKQIGRNEAAQDVTRETAEAENRMRDVVRPDDDAVARKLQDGSF
jgi:hypothetical protein